MNRPSIGQRSERRLSLSLALGAGLLAFVVHLNALANGWAVDDVQIIQNNPFVHGLGGIRPLLLGSYWPASDELYRPVALLSYAADWALFGDQPFWFHLHNVLLHVAVTLLVFAFLRRLGAAAVVAGLGAAVFAVHPVHVEAVANVVGRAELISMLFVMLGALLFLRDGTRPLVRVVGVSLCYLLSLGAKEIAVSLPGILLLLRLYTARDSIPRALLTTLRRDAAVYLSLVATLAAYLGLRYLAIGSTRGNGAAAYLDDLSTGDRLATAVRLWPEFTRLLFWPRDLAWEWGPGVITPVGWKEPLVYVGLAIGVAASGIALMAWREHRWISLAIGWFVVTAAVVSQIPFPIGVMLAERHLYLPSLAVALLVPGLASLLVAYPARVRHSAVGALLVLLCLGAWRTWDRNAAWFSTQVAYVTLGVEHPASFRSSWYAGTLLRRQGRLEDAIPLLRRAAGMMANRYYVLNVELADALLEAGEHEEAEIVLRRSIEVAPLATRAYLFLAGSLLQQERFEEAVTVLREGKGAAVDAENFAVAFAHHISIAYDGLGQLDSAMVWRSRGFDQAGAPLYQEWIHLARLRTLLGEPGLATAALDSARIMAPDSVRPLITPAALLDVRSAVMLGWGQIGSETGL
jgi:protein O-mannosyl-transferase